MATDMCALTEMKPEDWSYVSKLPGNSNCIDCNAKYPEWGSVNFGILFCTRCCSGHRSLGTHISRVRSVRMDAWTSNQIKQMRLGGNQSCQEWFAANGILTTAKSHKLKYDNNTAKLYTEVLKARVDGRQEPKSLADAKRSNNPKDWYRLLVKGEGPASEMVSNKKRRNIFQRISKISSSSDFWLFAYALSVVGCCVFWVAWKFQFRAYLFENTI